MREVGIGGCLISGISYEVDGFPIMVVFCNKGRQQGVGVWGSGTPRRREWIVGRGTPCQVRGGGGALNPCLFSCNNDFIYDLGVLEGVWLCVAWRGNRERGRGQGVFVGSWDGRMSCTGSFLRSGMIPNCGGVLE